MVINGGHLFSDSTPDSEQEAKDAVTKTYCDLPVEFLE